MNLDIPSYLLGQQSGGRGESTLINKTITKNGTYNASSDHADGYKKVAVLVKPPLENNKQGTILGTGGKTFYVDDDKYYGIGSIYVEGISAPQKDVNFIDYDGTILYSYTAQEALELSTLPSLTPHFYHNPRLDPSDWNWTLQEIKNQLATYGGPIWVGATYTARVGHFGAYIKITLTKDLLNPILTFAINGTAYIDWGDETPETTVSGESTIIPLNIPHTYSSSGDYIISIRPDSGAYIYFTSEGGTYSNLTLLHKNMNIYENFAYANCVKEIYLGASTVLSNKAFTNCLGLKYVIIHPQANYLDQGTDQFANCISLVSITMPRKYGIPPGYTDYIRENMFKNCHSLKTISTPQAIQRSNASAFENCKSLISTNAITPNQNMYNSCNCLSMVTLKEGLSGISNHAFYDCWSLSSITIPSTVEIISSNAFAGCSGVKEYHVKPTTPPILFENPFTGIASDCIIYVPAASVSRYKSAEIWSNYANQIQGE